MEGVEQLLCVCNDLGRHVQGCESLYGKYDEYWTPGMADAWDDPGIQTDIRRTIHRVLRDASEDTITAIQQNINPKTIKLLAHNLTSRYRHLFHRNNDYLTLPDDFVAPNIFLAMSKREKPTLPKPIIRSYLNTTVEISGNMVSPMMHWCW